MKNGIYIRYTRPLSVAHSLLNRTFTQNILLSRTYC